MSKSKIVGMMALIAFVTAIVLVNCAVAGEKFKGRIVWYLTKWEQLAAPGEEKHLMALCESRGIGSSTDGKPFGEGSVDHFVGIYDIDLKTETGFYHGYQESTDRDGNKIYYLSEAERIKGKFMASQWEGKYTILRGTGNYEGIKGEGTFSNYVIAPMQAYTDWEMEVQLPR